MLENVGKNAADRMAESCDKAMQECSQAANEITAQCSNVVNEVTAQLGSAVSTVSMWLVFGFLIGAVLFSFTTEITRHFLSKWLRGGLRGH